MVGNLHRLVARVKLKYELRELTTRLLVSMMIPCLIDRIFDWIAKWKFGFNYLADSKLAGINRQ